MKIIQQILLAGLLVVSPLIKSVIHAEENGKKKIVFVAGVRSHGYGSHEHKAGCMLLARLLNENMGEKVIATVVTEGWPKDPQAAFKNADALIFYCDGGGRHFVLPHLEETQKLVDKGVGIGCIHYGVEIPKGDGGDAFLRWIGGYFETFWSVNPHWTAQFKEYPKHKVANGLKPFEINDEWYFHMRFQPEMKGVTPIFSAIAPAETMKRNDGPHSGNPHVRKSVERGEKQHLSWVYERPNGGRGFGFTGGHRHWNWGDDNFRKMVLNAAVWIAGVDVPKNGVPSKTPTQEELEANQDYPKPGGEKKDGKNKSSSFTPGKSNQAVGASGPSGVSGPEGATGRQGEQGDPKFAVANLKVHEDLKASLFASEPDLLSPSAIDIDAKGRIWVCEVVNYRKHKDKRPEGDRILILEDTNGDNKADKVTTFYQGRDVDSAHGVSVFGEKVIVAVGDRIMVFTDSNGDDKPDSKENLFTGISGTQHDHGIHAVHFGPDGKFYFNFGNSGRQIKDKDGKTIIDKAGNEVNDSRKPYQQGMVFRCNPDGSDFETLGWNFRNNWEVCVDSFGTLWQSDNDDDGNRGVRINFVMEFGNYGYRDEFTGKGWRDQRNNMESEIPLRHWHLNDPGVVPNLLQTGAGSPTGITIYEGGLLPEVFQSQVIHCDAGPSIVRAYPVQSEGAGYTAEIVNILDGAQNDKWFRPSDVVVAPDGSLIVADWYDPGVGGHNMGDLDRGRLFLVAPEGHKYTVPKQDLTTLTGAAEALKSPNMATRYLAWNKLHEAGADAEKALLSLWECTNPVYRARALWLLGKIKGKEQKYVDAAIADKDANIRITGIRLARQNGANLIALCEKLAKDPSAQVRREVAIALRSNKSPKSADIWAELAALHDGVDRWYLEALGISAEGQWDRYFGAWLKKVGDKWNTPAGRDIIWRSRANEAPAYIVKILKDKNTPADTHPRYLRALDFHSGPAKDKALEALLDI